MNKPSDCKSVHKYMRLRIETTRVTQEATWQYFHQWHSGLRLLCLHRFHRLGGCGLRQLVLPGGNIAILSSMALGSTPSLPSSLSSPWGLRLLPSLLPSLPCCQAEDQERYLGNANVTQDKLP